MDLFEIWYIYVFFHEEHDGANIEWLTVMVVLLLRSRIGKYCFALRLSVCLSVCLSVRLSAIFLVKIMNRSSSNCMGIWDIYIWRQNLILESLRPLEALWGHLAPSSPGHQQCAPYSSVNRLVTMDNRPPMPVPTTSKGVGSALSYTAREKNPMHGIWTTCPLWIFSERQRSRISFRVIPVRY